MKKIKILIIIIISYVIGFYCSHWTNNKQRLEDEAFYFIKMNSIYQATFDTNQTDLEKSIALLMKIHTNRYLHTRSYSFFTESEDAMFCDALMFTDSEKERFNQFVVTHKLNNYLKEKINFCKQPLDFTVLTTPKN